MSKTADRSLGFWERLPKPFFALAPMAEVTDLAFRQMFVKYGKPDVLYTEFVSTDGLCSRGRENLLREMRFLKNERPIVAQIWGTKPEFFRRSALLLKKMGFDGIDINMGCPRPREVKTGGGAALIQNPHLAQKIISETKQAAGKLPVSIKTRLGFDRIRTRDWLGVLLKARPAAIILHARTAAEMSRPPAHWEEIAKAVKLRNAMKSVTLIIGNGDIQSRVEGLQKAFQTGADGVMVGRAAFGNPWFFLQTENRTPPGAAEKLVAMLEHARLFEKFFRGSKNFCVMKKHFKAYTAGFKRARALRQKLMAAENAEDAERQVKIFIAAQDPGI